MLPGRQPDSRSVTLINMKVLVYVCVFNHAVLSLAAVIPMWVAFFFVCVCVCLRARVCVFVTEQSSL